MSLTFGLKALQEAENLKKSKNLYDDIIQQVQNSKNNYADDYIQIEGLPLIQYVDLYQMNEDFFGWIKIDDSKINYPVVQTVNEPEKYLRKDFNGEYSIPGTIFLDYRDDADSDNLILYGHYMQNGTMFGDLTKYTNRDYLLDHQIIHFDTLYEERDYEVFSVFYDYVRNVDDQSFKYYNLIDIEDDEYNDIITILKDKSEVAVDVDIETGDQLLMLSTCSYYREDGRFVVVAHKIDKKLS